MSEALIEEALTDEEYNDLQDAVYARMVNKFATAFEFIKDRGGQVLVRDLIDFGLIEKQKMDSAMRADLSGLTRWLKKRKLLKGCGPRTVDGKTDIYILIDVDGVIGYRACARCGTKRSDLNRNIVVKEIVEYDVTESVEVVVKDSRKGLCQSCSAMLEMLLKQFYK